MRPLAPLTEFDDSAIGNVVDTASAVYRHGRDEWRTLELCGRGGTAEVYRALGPQGQVAALKRLKPDLRHRTDLKAALRREHDLLRRIASPQLVAPLALLESGDGPALALEYLPNGDLVSLLGLPVAQWLPALRDVAAALNALHAHGVAHGDLKARNVLFGADQKARVIDLTGARALDEPAVRATAAYAVPAAMQASARAADVFALATLVFELVMARLPYGGAGAVRVRDVRPAPWPVEPAARRLLGAALATLEVGGGGPQGLSPIADVIESVSATGA
jgi:serine/threonine protein kinase